MKHWLLHLVGHTVINSKREVEKQLEGRDIEDIEIHVRKRGRPLLLPEEIDELTRK